MNAPTVDIRDYLVAQGMGAFAATSGWALYISSEPASPHTTITLYDLPGEEPLYSSGIEHPAVQVRVRGSPGGYLAAYDKARQIRDLLVMGGPFSVGSATYNAWIEGDIGHLETDNQGRPIFVATYRLQRSEK